MMIVLNQTDYPGWNEETYNNDGKHPNSTYEACGTSANYNSSAPVWPASADPALGNRCVNVT